VELSGPEFCLTIAILLSLKLKKIKGHEICKTNVRINFLHQANHQTTDWSSALYLVTPESSV
jgi:hypothetical protein